MIAYYAMGGGLGHLTRARAFLHTRGLDGDAVILTSSAFARDSRVTGSVPCIVIPQELQSSREQHRAWLEEWLDSNRPERFIVDAFPCGITGELENLRWPSPVELEHVARLLRWNRYSRYTRGDAPRFVRTWMVEALDDEHLRYLRTISDHIEVLHLNDPPSASVPSPFGETPAWLITHSDGGEELEQLIRFAAEMRELERSSARLWVSGAQPPPARSEDVDGGWLTEYPAAPLFEHAERIITAAGFNSMRQTERYATKHHFLPFTRHFDDQFARAGSSRCRTMSRPRTSASS